jgi:hypothetical protein
MNGILCDPNIVNSTLGSAFSSWMLPFNLINIVDLLDFPICFPINLISNEALQLALVCPS